MAKWTLFAHNGLEYGPVEEKELVSWIRERRISSDDLLRMDGARQWELAGEIDIFSPYFKDMPGEAGRIKKNLKNESEKLKSAQISAGSNCEGCSFMEGVERLHEEKKILEEKLAEKSAELRGVSFPNRVKN